MTQTTTALERFRWRPTWALRRAAALLIVPVGAGLILGRPSLAMLALPLAVGTAMSWASRTGSPSPGLRVETPAMVGQGGTASAEVELTGLDHAQLATVRLPRGIGSPAAPLIVLGTDQAGHRLDVPVDTSVWGVHQFGPAGLRVAAADGLLASELIAARVPAMRVLPAVQTIPAPELPARAAGQVGAHRTRRPGDGSELLDIREFRPGDRIRRIDWRVSARRDTLHVRRTAIDSDADLVICLDTRFDLGADVGSWSTSTSRSPADRRASLATTVSAAAALAGTYLRLGDRVGLVDLSVPQRGVPPGTGYRQLMRIRWQLAGVTPESYLGRRELRDAMLPAGAVVVVLSPFVDAQVDVMVASMVRTGRDVIGVDVLPDPVLTDADRQVQVATRLLMAERHERLAALRRRGVLVTSWDPALIGLLMRRRQRARRRA